MWICLNCLKEISVKPKDIKTEILNIDTICGVPFEMESRYVICPFCGQRLVNDNILDEDLNRAYKKYDILKGGDQCLPAIAIAAQVISMYHDYGHGITNLKLQKVLFYIQMLYLKRYHKPAFPDDIEAWRSGPAVRDVYEYFRKYMIENISVTDRVVQENYFEIKKELKESIEFVVKRTLEYDPWDMVKMSQQKVWKDNYIKANYCLIDNKSIATDGEFNI